MHCLGSVVQWPSFSLSTFQSNCRKVPFFKPTGVQWQREQRSDPFSTWQGRAPPWIIWLVLGQQLLKTQNCCGLLQQISSGVNPFLLPLHARGLQGCPSFQGCRGGESFGPHVRVRHRVWVSWEAVSFTPKPSRGHVLTGIPVVA